MQTRGYQSLHCHSEYSNIKIIDSINRFNRMVDYAWDIGLSGIAMTEHDCLSGTLFAIDVFKKKLDKEWVAAFPNVDKPSYEEMSRQLDFKVVLGNEIYLTPEGLNRENATSADFYHYLLIAKDAKGYEQLKKLSSAAWQRAWFKGILRTPTYPSDLFDIVQGGHLVCSTACLGGYAAWCWKMIQSCDDDAQMYYDKLDNHLGMMEDLFGKGNFFIELQPNDEKHGKEQNDYNKFMINRYWGLYPFIFTTDAHYLNQDEREIHKAFLNSKSSKDREVDDFYYYAYIMSQNEVRELMPYVSDSQFNEMVQNSRRIKDMCTFYELEQPKVLAKVEYEHWDEYDEDLPIFDEISADLYPVFYSYLNSENRADKGSFLCS